MDAVSKMLSSHYYGLKQFFFFMKHKNEIVILDTVSAAWLQLRSEITHKTTTETIGELVREKIAASDSSLAVAASN